MLRTPIRTDLPWIPDSADVWAVWSQCSITKYRSELPQRIDVTYSAVHHELMYVHRLCSYDLGELR